MSLQNYLLCILYAFLIILHSFTLIHRDFHRGLISIFSFALFTQTISTILFTLQQTVTNHNYSSYFSKDFTSTLLATNSIYNVHFFSQIIHIVSINFFILFLLIVAKGWPITRRDMPHKYIFFTFWLMCLAADLITFCWMYYDNNNNYLNRSMKINSTSTATVEPVTNKILANETNQQQILETNSSTLTTIMTTTNTPTLLLRFIIMIYFLLELRTTMILEQEQKKLEFYLHFGALSMVWFVHSLIVYLISMRVEIWQSKLVSGFSSAANFLAFAVTTGLLWPKSSRSYLFKKGISNVNVRNYNDESDENDLNDVELGRQTVSDSNLGSEEYDGLEMRDLTKKQ